MSDGIDVVHQEALQRARSVVHGDADVIAGPWTGEVGFELMYWIPFLTWLVDQGLNRQRIVVVSRGGAGLWYRHLTNRYVDILDLMTPDEFRERTAGKKKQYDSRREVDKELLTKTRDRLGLNDVDVLHPAVMFRLFVGLWRRRVGIELVQAFSRFQPLTPPTSTERPAGLPGDYVVAKFYFSKAFPETVENKAFISDVLRTVSRQVPVALLSTSLRLDEHSDYQSSSGSGVYVVDAHETPQKNLERQTALIAGARGFVGTYGGFSYLAPFYGRPSLSFFSRRGFEAHHLDLAQSVFDRLLPGGFHALDRRATTAVDSIVNGWAAAGVAT
ncbi:MAG TPA: hypothetical protein VMS40_23825 [Vicinamibacterales bacterium]|nr:hypothetical protein [Vicinamibacterales bacterium]